MMRILMIAMTTAALVGAVVGANAQARGDRVGERGAGDTRMERSLASPRGDRANVTQYDLGVVGYGCTAYPDYGLHVSHFC